MYGIQTDVSGAAEKQAVAGLVPEDREVTGKEECDMREKPILFSAPMVQAILNERKTQTRRVMKPQPISKVWGSGTMWWHWKHRQWPDGNQDILKAALDDYTPYQPGDVLWVRETFATFEGAAGAGFIYKADAEHNPPIELCIPDRWKPSTHMPREAARIFLRVTDVRVERLQEISEADAKAEGIRSYWRHKEYGEEWHECNHTFIGAYVENSHSTRREAFAELWDSLAKGDTRWENNPWVWVYTFERIEEAAM